LLGESNVTREELLARLASLRQARVGQLRVPHKPLLLLWLFGQFATTGNSAATYQQAEEPVSQLINDFGPPVASAAAARQRAAMPFVHLERELWDLRDAVGREIGPDAPDRSVLQQPAAAGARSGRASARPDGTAPGRPRNASRRRPPAA
jgi:putative restriction endonuclease